MADFTKLTGDAELWTYFRQGDENAYTELARRYYRTLLHYGLRFTPNLQLVEDILQDLLVHLWLHRDSISDTPYVKFYLVKAFRHRMIKTIRPLSGEVELTDHFDSVNPEFSSEDMLIGDETEIALTRQVRNAIDKLPARQQEVIYLRFFQNLRPDEIAGLLSINPQSVSNIIQRALSNLRDLWHTAYPILFYSFYQILY
ncbi:RNA polymerase sigma factor [Dyadobacter sandarakinus]|uniref:Sigma-70 family RNA polymerase sigma factor n=1 Tax=Dyadobacter sandarakinus TaxID=2747268 RepID=A0ABX7IDS4_9BACT|nr:sigma-70 family RNA polymerase sigma factor [Dyadobacter sandarakinus]QRR03853.1 sigma-70 family RNA polymerase sigma factor [Dyadobacter sandarakinus]